VIVVCGSPAAGKSQLALALAEPSALPHIGSDVTLAVVLRERAVWEPLDELAPETHLVLRSDRPVGAQVADLLALLDRRLGRLPAARAT